MIPISLTTAFIVYSVALAAIFLVLYLYTEMRVRRSQQTLAQQFLWRCVYCGFTYLDERASAVSECPRCHSFNDEAEVRPRALHSRSDDQGARLDNELLEEARRNPSRRKRPHQTRRGPRRRR